MLRLGLNYFAREDYYNAMKCLKYIMKEYYENRMVVSNPEKINRLKVCSIFSLMSNNHRKQSNYKKAIDHIEKSFKICQTVFPNENRNLNYCTLFITRGKILCDMDQYDKAASDFYTAQKIYERHLDYGEFCSLRFGLLFKEMGNIELKRNQFQKALTLYKQSLKSLEKIYPDMVHKSASATLNDMASLCIKFKKFDLASGYLDKALELNKKLIKGSESVEISTNYHTYGNLYMKKGYCDKALEYYEKARAIATSCLKGEVNVDVARTSFQIGMAYKKKGDLGHAKETFKYALKIFKTVFKDVEVGGKLIKKCQDQIGKIDRMTNRQELNEIIAEQKMLKGL